jgi:uncharacterized membrane protein
VWPGALVGRLIFDGIAMLTVKNGTTGWESVIVAVVILLGVFIGSIAGGIADGVLGARRTKKLLAYRADSTN